MINLISISFWIYFKSKEAIIYRASEHLTSVNSLAQDKLSLYLTNLKLIMADPSGNFSKNKSYVGVCSLGEPKCSDRKLLSLMDNMFSPFSQTEFVFRRSAEFYFFNFKGISHILHERQGLGNSGEIYIVGSDHFIRSASRFISDLSHFKINNEASKNSLQGKRGVAIVDDYRGVKVISAYSRFTFDHLEYALLSEMDWDEVNLPLKEIQHNLLGFGFFLVLGSLVVAYVLSKKTVQVVDQMEKSVAEKNAVMAINVLKIQEEEREKISYSLHDSVGQSLTALNWSLNDVEKKLQDPMTKDQVHKLLLLSEDIIQELRSISQDIMPSLLKDFGCVSAIKSYLDERNEFYEFKFHFQFDDEIESLAFKHSFALNLYRMIQELVQNAAKHAHAKNIYFKFLLDKDSLELLYSDDGVGYNSKSPLPNSLHYRSQLFKGHMDRIVQTPGTGFKFEFSLKEIINEKS
jgi:signal transduction histidine kinase